MIDVILKRFDNPDETRIFEKGKFETVTLGGMTIGRATYEPGWKWSVDVGQEIGEPYHLVLTKMPGIGLEWAFFLWSSTRVAASAGLRNEQEKLERCC